ncbi:hypothetical protein HK098_003230, partial [Nowakowskiella sp. JEL0407]
HSELNSVDWNEFVLGWYDAYLEASSLSVSDESTSELILKETLILRLSSLSITCFTEEEISVIVGTWYKIEMYKDSPTGIKRVKEEYITGTLSSTSLSTLAHLARFCKTCWNVQLSSEVLGYSTFDSKLYKKAAKVLGLHPSQVVYVSSEYKAVKAAAEAGLVTVFIKRGGRTTYTASEIEEFDIVVDDMAGLESVVAQYSEAKLEELTGKKSKRSWFQKLADVATDVGKAVTRVAED